MNCQLKTNLYKCTECDRNFNNQRHYKKHIDGHKNNNCKHCDEKFTHRKHLKHHLLFTHNIRENACFHCTECNAKYVKRVTLISHIIKNHANGKFPCKECGKIFDTNEECKLHLEEHYQQKPFTCERCSAKFYRKQQYLVHMKQHDKYKCITCNENYADKNNLLKHKRWGHETHGIEQQYKCELCETILSSKILLNVHLRKHKTKKNHLENSLQLNKYKKESLNNKHIKNQPEFDTIMNDLQYICTMCKKMFGKKSQLNQHRERVHGKHKYHCSLCSHQSNNKTNLMQHIRLHLTHEREFVCDQCGKSFYRNSTLKEHKILQHNEKDQQFACEICGKLFKRNCEVSRHLLTHSEERPHTCSQCGQSYKRKTHLQRHQLATHGTTTNSNQRHVQRLLKNSNGELIPSKQYKEINSSLEIQAKDLIPINKIPTDNIPMYNFMNNCEEFMYSNSEELWIDNKSNNIVVEYITDTDNQTNTSEAEQYLNQSTLHLDHIDAKDLIVLSTEQMFNVNVVEDDNVSNKDMLPQYLRTFQYL